MTARRLIRKVRVLLRRKAKRLTPEGRREIEERIAKLEVAVSRKAKKQVKEGRAALQSAIARHIPKRKREIAWEWAYSLAAAFLIALVIRQCGAESYKVPTSSMVPTLSVGDKILVNRFVYGVKVPLTGIRFLDGSEPKRWDVIVFTTRGIPKASQYPKNFVKRVVGLPGETLEIRDGGIYKYVSGQDGSEKAVRLERREGVPQIHYTNVEKGRPLALEESDYVRLFGVRLWKKGSPRVRVRGTWQYGLDGQRFTVPKGHCFVLGDNTEVSLDSRAWGFVPFKNVKGKAMCKWSFLPPWGRGVVR